MTAPDIDEAALASWLGEQGRVLSAFQRLGGDVSPRRYARVDLRGEGAAIVAAYGPETGDACRRFERTTALLEQAAIRVPAILAADCARGLMLLEDAGRETLFDLRAEPLEERLAHYRSAVTIALRFAELDRERVANLNPALDAELLRRELRQTVEVFLEPEGLTGSERTRQVLERSLDRLCAALAREPAVPCHRDFMCRNLVPHPADGLIVLDHQDLRLGPPGYDLASLLNDSFYPPPEVEAELLGDLLADDGARLAYHRAAVQRTLKAVGTFAAFARRGFERHVPLIAPTLGRALDHVPRVPELAPLAGQLRELWEPALRVRRPG